MRAYNHSELIGIEKTIATLLLATLDIWAQLWQKNTLFDGRANQAAPNTQDGMRILRRLEFLLNYYLLAIFVVGHLVRSCTWTGRTDGSGIVATCVPQRCVGLLVDLAGQAAVKKDYVPTICCALLHNRQWHDDTPGAAHVEECCEALVAKLRAVVEAQRDTTYLFPKKENGGMLTAAFMKSVPKRFVRTLIGGQGLRDDAMDYTRQYIPLRPPVNRREARAAVETVGFIPIAMENIVRLLPNAMCIHDVPATTEDGVPLNPAKDAADVDALSDGLVPVVLSGELREFDWIDSD